MLRRTIGFFLTVFLTAVAAYQVAWHQDLREKFTKNSLSSLGLLVLVLAAIGVLVLSSVRHNGASATIGCIMGIVATLWARELLDGIDLTTLLWLGACILGLIVLWAITVWDALFERVPSIHIGNNSSPRSSRTTPRSGTGTVPVPPTTP